MLREREGGKKPVREGISDVIRTREESEGYSRKAFKGIASLTSEELLSLSFFNFLLSLSSISFSLAPHLMTCFPYSILQESLEDFFVCNFQSS